MAIDAVAFKRPKVPARDLLPCHEAVSLYSYETSQRNPAHRTDMIDQQITSGIDVIHRRNLAKTVA